MQLFLLPQQGLRFLVISLTIMPLLLSLPLNKLSAETVIAGNNNKQHQPSPVTIQLSNETKAFTIQSNLSLYLDNNNDLTINQIATIYQDQFKKVQNYPLQSNNTQATHWIKLIIENTNKHRQAKQWVLESEYSAIDHFDLFEQLSEGRWKSESMGLLTPFHDRQHRVADLTYSFEINPGETKHLYIKLQSRQPIVLPLKLSQEATFKSQQSKENIQWGIYFGLLLVMFFYNSFIYASVGAKSSLFYVTYLMTNILLVATISSHSFLLLWPEAIHWNHSAHTLFSACALALGCGFVQRFLNTRESNPEVNKQLTRLSILALFTASLAVITQQNYPVMVIGLSAICAGFIFYAGLVAYQQGSKRAASFILSSCALRSLGLLVYWLAIIGILPINTFTLNALHIAIGLEVFLLSLGLADHINRMKKATYLLQKQANQTLASKNRELQKALQTKDEFLNLISHELRTPMKLVLDRLDLAHASYKNNHPKDSLINLASHSAEQMAKILESILTFIELQSGRIKTVNENFEIERLIGEIISRCRDQVDKEKLEIKQWAETSIQHSLIGDKNAIQKIVDLLLDNSIKFTDSGTIEVRSDLKKVANGSSQLEISISDTGIGIPSAHLSKVKNSFYQVEKATDAGKGIGMGLANCEKLLDLIDGQLAIDSQEGEGTQVKISIPIAEGAPLPSQAKKSSASLAPEPQALLDKTEISKAENQHCDNTKKTAKTKAAPALTQATRILIVEDNPTNMMVAKSMVKKLGASILTAENGQEALDLLAKENVDLILMDCQMPIMDGYAATKAIRASELPCKDIPIIAVTANATSEDRHQCFDSGMNDHIPKPFKTKTIHEKILHWLKQAK